MLTDRYWIYKEQFLQGPYPASELATMPDFSDRLLVCQDGDDRWLPVIQLQAFRPYVSSQTPPDLPPSDHIVSTGDYQPPEP